MSDKSNEASSDKDNTEQDDGTPCPPTALGWAVRIVSLLLIAGLFGVIIWQAVLKDDEISFSVEVATEDIREQDGQFLLPVDITNDGSFPAQHLRMELQADGEPVDVEIPLIGHNETVRYVIGAESRNAEVNHRIISYEAP